MAVIGQALTTPQSGWKRYDSQSGSVKFTGNWLSTSNASYYNGSNIYTTDINAKASFYFEGTKIRIVGYRDPSRGIAKIKVDGIEENIIQSGTAQMQTLEYEKLDLLNKRHFVEISFHTNSIDVDAIDIDSNGRLYHIDEVTDISDLEVGKRIRCHYQATSNAVGTFSGLGEETSDFIPVVSSATPNGDFYFIMVEDWNNKKILVADRNIQHSISWDKLNTAGIASGSGVLISMVDRIETTFRLLTGGVTSTDKDNEWDKYIVNSTLDGTITAGDVNVWNWSYNYTWSSTTNNYANTSRTVRGTVNVGTLTYTTSSNVVYGFRPVLEIEILSVNKSFILHDGGYKKWIEGNPTITKVAEIPTMTSNTNPSGEISSNITPSHSTYDFYNAFNKNSSTYFQSTAGFKEGWLSYEFPYMAIINRYTLQHRSSYQDRMPKDWTFEGSNDGVDWIALDTQVNQTTWTVKREFMFSNNTPYKIYRINITANNGDSNFLSFNEIEMFGQQPTIPEVLSSWETVSNILPTASQFLEHGGNLSSLERNVVDLNPIATTERNELLGVGEVGKVFGKTIDLKKYFDIRNIKTEVK